MGASAVSTTAARTSDAVPTLSHDAGEGVDEAFDWLFKQAHAQAYTDSAPRKAVAPSFTKADLEAVNR